MTFKEFDRSIYTTDDNFMTSEIDFWMNPASINTGDTKLDEHLKSDDFFDVENHKQITVVGNTYEKVENDGSYELWDDLTMKGIASPRLASIGRTYR
jgi:polyisoprenoid-binding protein YceI